MILHCPTCGAQYDVPADAAANPGVIFRCTTCETMFSPAEGLSAPPSSGAIAGRLPPPRGLGQATEGVESVISGPRALPPSNLPPTFRDPLPPAQPSGAPGGMGGLPSGFRDGVFESQAAVAAPDQVAVPRQMDSLPVARGVNCESQSSKAVSTVPAEMGLPAPGVPVQPIDAEEFFDDDAGEDTGGGGSFRRADTGLRGAAGQANPSESVELPTNPGLSGFGVPALGAAADEQARQTVPAGYDHAAAAFAGATAMSPNDAATVAAPAANFGAPAAAGAPPPSVFTEGPIAGDVGPDPGAPPPPVAGGAVFGNAANPTDVHQASDSASVRGASQSTESQGPPADSGVWDAEESKVISLPDVPLPTSFDSNELDAVPVRNPLPPGVPATKPTTGGIRRISPNRTGSSSAAVPAAPRPGFGPSDNIHDTGAPASTSEGSTVFRLSELDSQSGMGLDPGLAARVRHSADEDEELDPKRVTQRIDPHVEFHDVFQDIRRAEKGDDRTASERYFDTGLFSGVGDTSPEAAEKAQKERDERESRAREGRLNLKAGAGGLAQRIEREVAQPDVGAGNDDDVLAAALAESGLREPSQDYQAVQERERRAVVDLDLAGESSSRTAFPNAARYLSVLLVFVFASVGFVGFVAAKNGGLLDFGAFGQMVAVAFKGATYEPRHQTVVQVVQSAEGWVEHELDQMPSNDGNALAVGDLVGGQYEAGHGAVFTLVDGTVTNTTERVYRGAVVEVTLTAESGEVEASRQIPVGPGVAQPQLESMLDEDAVDAEYVRLTELFADVEFEPGAVATFSAAFILAEGIVAEELVFAAHVVSAERPLDSCWADVEFSTPDDVTTPTEE